MGVKSIAAIIAASLVAGFVLGGLGVAGAGSTTAPPAVQMRRGACGDGAGACGDAASAQCDQSQKAACPSTTGEAGACGQGSCP